MGYGEICSEISVPFSWEVKPGISKYTKEEHLASGFNTLELPLPPCLLDKPRLSLQSSVDLYEHDVLCPSSFEKPRLSVNELPTFARSSSKKGLWKHHVDPFEVAYKECTKTPSPIQTQWFKMLRKSLSVRERRLKRGFFDFSCKQSCNIRKDNIVKM